MGGRGGGEGRGGLVDEEEVGCGVEGAGGLRLEAIWLLLRIRAGGLVGSVRW